MVDLSEIPNAQPGTKIVLKVEKIINPDQTYPIVGDEIGGVLAQEIEAGKPIYLTLEKENSTPFAATPNVTGVGIAFNQLSRVHTQHIRYRVLQR